MVKYSPHDQLSAILMDVSAGDSQIKLKLTVNDIYLFESVLLSELLVNN